MSAEPPLVSFITSLKLCAGYIDFKYRIKMYIEQIYKYCTKLNIPYEIIICEDIDHKNDELLKNFFNEEYLNKHKVILLERKQDYYNPLKHNMLEAPNKNKAILSSKGKYLCCTSGDILMNKEFFSILSTLKENIFYRFLSFEVKELDIEWAEATLEYVEEYAIKNTTRCYNERVKQCQHITDIAYKSGDIMLMDRKNWIKIRGFPQCGLFHHTDYVACKVVENNKITIVIFNEPIRIYSLVHSRKEYKHLENNNNNQPNNATDINELNIGRTTWQEMCKMNPHLIKYLNSNDIDRLSWQKACEMNACLTCN